MGSPALDAAKWETRTPIQPIKKQQVEEGTVVDEKKLTSEQIAAKKAEEAKKDVVIGTALLRGVSGENVRASIPAVAGNFTPANNIWNNPTRYISSNHSLWGAIAPETKGKGYNSYLSENSNSNSNSGDSHEGRNHQVVLSKHIAKDSADGMEDVRFKKLELMG